MFFLLTRYFRLRNQLKWCMVTSIKWRIAVKHQIWHFWQIKTSAPSCGTQPARKGTEHWRRPITVERLVFCSCLTSPIRDRSKTWRTGCRRSRLTHCRRARWERWFAGECYACDLAVGPATRCLLWKTFGRWQLVQFLLAIAISCTVTIWRKLKTIAFETIRFYLQPSGPEGGPWPSCM